MKKFFFLLLSLFFLASFTTEEHPYHVGSVEFNYNSKSQTYEITGRFFLDDLENAVNGKFGTAVYFQRESDHARMDELLKKYCADYLRLKSDNQFVTLKYLGYEEDSEAVNIYLESEKVKPPKKVETSVSMLYNLFDDQSNIIHTIVDLERKSTRLSFPDRYSYQNF